MIESIEELLKRAVAMHSEGRIDDAANIYEIILARDPENTDALHLSGLAAQFRGDVDQALTLIGRAVQLAPDFVQYRSNLGILLQEAGRLDLALEAFREAIAINRKIPELFYHLGNALRETEQPGEALNAFQDAVALKSDYSEALSNIAVILRERGEDNLALVYLERAVKSAAPFPPAYTNLCAAYTEASHFEAAIEAGQVAVELSPEDTAAHFNLGNAFSAAGRPAEACASYDEVLALDATHEDAWCNLGAARLSEEDAEGAIEAFDRAIALNDRIADAHWNRALAHLTLGHFAEGWDGYDWRWEAVPWLEWRQFERPHWHGEALQGRTVLIHTEQGYGDTLQFVRYLPKIREMGGRVKLACQPALKRLLLDLPGLEGVTGYGEPPGPFDFHLPIMSLPKVFGLRFEEIEACNSPYLVASADHTDLVPSDGLPKVGLVWRGSTINLKGMFRSCRLSDFEGVLKRKDLQFYSLQVDITEQERDVLQSYGGIDLSSQIKDFADSAALTKHMDLILSVDTAQAHLAGGLGIPVWMLLARGADWRWFRFAENSPWYPSMRIFRQTERGNWRIPIGNIENMLDTFFSAGR